MPAIQVCGLRHFSTIDRRSRRLLVNVYLIEGLIVEAWNVRCG